MKQKRIIAVLVGCALLAMNIAAQTRPIKIFGYELFKQVLEGTAGGAKKNLVAAQNEFKLEWELTPFAGYQQKMLQALFKPVSDFDVVFILDTWSGKTALDFAESLDSYVKTDPIKNFGDFIPGTLDAFKNDGELKAIPFRTAFHVLHFNKDMYASKIGKTDAPATMEEFWANVAKTTYTNEKGEKVYGLSIYGGPAGGKEFIKLAMAYGAEILSPSMKIRVAEPDMIAFVKDISDAHKKGYVVPNFDTIAAADVRNYVSQGLAAHTVVVYDFNYKEFNNASKSRVAGQIAHSPLPSIERLKLPVAAHQVAVWGMAIPKNLAKDRKKAAWDFIKWAASPETILDAALNTNGPVRLGALSSATFISMEPTAKTLLAVAPTAKLIIPPFDGAQESIEIYGEEVTNAMKGTKTPEKAMKDAQTRIQLVLERLDIKSK